MRGGRERESVRMEREGKREGVRRGREGERREKGEEKRKPHTGRLRGRAGLQERDSRSGTAGWKGTAGKRRDRREVEEEGRQCKWQEETKQREGEGDKPSEK